MTTLPRVRDAQWGDAAQIAAIYNHYIRETVITFEVEELAADDIAHRVATMQGAGLPWLVVAEHDTLLGYAYAGPFRPRAAFLHTLEASIYLDTTATSRGLGTALYTELFARLRDLDERQSPHAPVHAVVGGIALPNDASVALHERFGMTHIGTFTEVGRKFDRWIDVGYWQIELA